MQNIINYRVLCYCDIVPIDNIYNIIYEYIIHTNCTGQISIILYYYQSVKKISYKTLILGQTSIKLYKKKIQIDHKLCTIIIIIMRGGLKRLK